MNILITGGAGYLGSVLCEKLLQEGYHVSIVDNLLYGQAHLFHLASKPQFEFFRGDARDARLMKELLRKADVCIPLAAVVGAPACDRDPLMAESVNLEAIKLLCKLRSPSQLIVFPTTNSGYGTQSGAVACTEETPLEPISLYGITKVKAEAAILDLPNTVTLRLATVFGLSPRMRLDLLVNHFVHAAVTQGSLVIFEKDFRRNFVHIQDVADCFMYCIQHSKVMAGRPYNVGLDAANLSKEQLAYKIKEYVPNFSVHFATCGSDPDKRDYIVSNQRLRDVGFEAKHSLDEGIQELIKGYRLLTRGGFANA